MWPVKGAILGLRTEPPESPAPDGTADKPIRPDNGKAGVTVTFSTNLRFVQIAVEAEVYDDRATAGHEGPWIELQINHGQIRIGMSVAQAERVAGALLTAVHRAKAGLYKEGHSPLYKE